MSKLIDSDRLEQALTSVKNYVDNNSGGGGVPTISTTAKIWELDEGTYRIGAPNGAFVRLYYSTGSYYAVNSGLLTVATYSDGVYYTLTNNKSTGSDGVLEVIAGKTQTNATSLYNRSLDTDLCLKKNNTKSYNVTSNYNPTHKLYVDTAISNAVGNINTILATLTTVEED